MTFLSSFTCGNFPILVAPSKIIVVLLDPVSLICAILSDMKLDGTYHLPTPANSICLSTAELTPKRKQKSSAIG